MQLVDRRNNPLMLMALVAGTFLVLYAFQRSYYDFYSDLPMLLAAGLLGPRSAQPLAMRARLSG